jgi:hypothetical protein
VTGRQGCAFQENQLGVMGEAGMEGLVTLVLGSLAMNPIYMEFAPTMSCPRNFLIVLCSLHLPPHPFCVCPLEHRYTVPQTRQLTYKTFLLSVWRLKYKMEVWAGWFLLRLPHWHGEGCLLLCPHIAVLLSVCVSSVFFSFCKNSSHVGLEPL